MAGQIKKRHNRRRNKMPKDNVTTFPPKPAPKKQAPKVGRLGCPVCRGDTWHVAINDAGEQVGLKCAQCGHEPIIADAQNDT